jgi:glycosyltransferase involved in cell wall biosynthesis
LAADPGPGAGTGGYALFIGRLTEEKGIDVLCRAWRELGSTIPLKIVGDGPLKSSVQSLNGIEYLGQCPRPQVLGLLQQAAFLVVPSLWYEGFPMVIVEALACGTPVIASALGSMNELVEDGVNGLRFAPGDAQALIACARKLGNLRTGARVWYERNYTAERNYAILMQIYTAAAARHDN